MKKTLIFVIASLLASCSGGGLISDKARKAEIEQKLESRKGWIPAIPADISAEEQDALKFLYAYMPVGDAWDFSQELYLTNVRTTLKAKDSLGWNVPEEIFLSYVLPVRVNNENLDTSRVTFYNELKDRVKGLSMRDAILEVNHWCHEKVVYTPSDARTSAPSASVRSAYGRCGEESTFTVAALRAVGIPSRQVYTPRWAHSDDNHAWVEAWADGEWVYIGACEPEPVVNTGWFDAPAARALLMHTKVFGKHYGTEEVISENDCFVEINVTKNYADVASAVVEVVDNQGKAVAGANVDFGIYNYAQFYPAARKKADSVGRTSLSAGLGSMVVWANDGANYGFSQLNFGQDSLIRVVLNNPVGVTAFDIVPPAGKSVSREITPAQRAENNLRLAVEDSIRNCYTSTFATAESAAALAARIGAQAADVERLLSASRGNHAQIAKFLKETPKEQLSVALMLLNVVSAKDLRDTPADVLRDHLTVAYQYRNAPFFEEYILNPRVGYELLTPFRTRFAQVGGCATAQELIATTKSVKLVPELNPGNFHITPLAVHDSRMADKAAYERYVITLLRSKGYAARLEPVTENLQYYDTASAKWVNITTAAVPEKGKVVIEFKGKEEPKLMTHFTLAKLTDGVFNTVNLRSSRSNVDMGGEKVRGSLFNSPLELEQGRYMLVSGTRLASGAVLVNDVIFDVEAGRESKVELIMRQDDAKVKVIGEMNPESLYVRDGNVGSLLATTGRGYFILALVGAKQEPTNHAMRDLAALKDFYEKWGRSIVLVFKDAEQFSKFDAQEFGVLPNTVVAGYDNEGQTAAMLKDMMKIQNINNLPIFIIADTFGRVVFFSQGYQIGLGEQMKRVIDNL